MAAELELLLKLVLFGAVLDLLVNLQQVLHAVRPVNHAFECTDMQSIKQGRGVCNLLTSISLNVEVDRFKLYMKGEAYKYKGQMVKLSWYTAVPLLGTGWR